MLSIQSWDYWRTPNTVSYLKTECQTKQSLVKNDYHKFSKINTCHVWENNLIQQTILRLENCVS